MMTLVPYLDMLAQWLRAGGISPPTNEATLNARNAQEQEAQTREFNKRYREHQDYQRNSDESQ